MAKIITTPNQDEAQKAVPLEPVEFLVFSGGGAKGAIYSGAVEALEESGVRDGVSAVAGASAGAITAALIATGISAKRFKQVSQHTDFKNDLLGSRDILSGLSGQGVYQAQGIEDMLNENMLYSVRKALGDKKHIILDAKVASIAIERLAQIDDKKKSIQHELDAQPTEEQQKNLQDQLNDLLEQSKMLQIIKDGKVDETDEQGKKMLAGYKDFVERCRKNEPLLFKDLTILRVLDPNKFKSLVVNATKQSTMTMAVFSEQTTPDVPIATAVHASCSIPGVFKPVRIGDEKYVDGGVSDNIPTQLLADSGIKDITRNPEKASGRMLAFAFGGGDNNSSINTSIWSMRKFYSSSKIVKFLIDVVFMKVFANVSVPGISSKSYTTKNQETYERLREHPLDIIALDTKDVGTLSFSDAHQKSSYLHIKGEIQTKNHLENHRLIPENPSFRAREFMLKVYEDCTIKHDGLKPVLKHDSDKAKKLLRFCEDEQWVAQNSTQPITQEERITKIQEYVTEVGRGQYTKQLDVASDTMPRLIAALNDPTTPTTVKTDFIQALGIQELNGQAIEIDAKNQPINDPQTPQSFKFKPEHFGDLLAKEQVKQKHTFLGDIKQTFSKHLTTRPATAPPPLKVPKSQSPSR